MRTAEAKGFLKWMNMAFLLSISNPAMLRVPETTVSGRCDRVCSGYPRVH